jgi:FtsP/CotA-like multicopper oxidase with cupredoxin domain
MAAATATAAIAVMPLQHDFSTMPAVQLKHIAHVSRVTPLLSLCWGTALAGTLTVVTPTLVTPTVVDPAVTQTAVTPRGCPRPQPGTALTEPVNLRSQHGRLSLDLTVQNERAADGGTRFCYVLADGTESPTLRVKPGDWLIIRLRNHLENLKPSAPDEPMMASMHHHTQPAAHSDPCHSGVMSMISTNLHFHGLTAPPTCHADEVLRTSIQPTDRPFEYRFKIPANEPPGLYWYHPHIHGFSARQVSGGASGALIVEGLERAIPEVAGLPERVIVIRDQDLLHPNASPATVDPATTPFIDHDGDAGNAGNTGTGFGRPARDLSVNFTPLPYPDYPPATIAMKPGEPNGAMRFYLTVEGQPRKVFDPSSPTPNIVVQQGAVEDWIIENQSSELHAFHIHQIHFEIRDWLGVQVNEPFVRDTINVPYWTPSMHSYPTIKLRMDFRDPDAVGIFPYHCHLLDHEDADSSHCSQFLNSLVSSNKVNLGTSYYAVGHPSLTNYLEIVGGSNFGVRSDNPPDWHNLNCKTNLQTGLPNADIDTLNGVAPVPVDTSSVICPIRGTGTDADTPAIDTWNETNPPVFNFLAEIDGVKSVPASSNITGKTIADQLAESNMSWRSYQENLPLAGADNVNDSNGTATQLTKYDPNEPLSPTNLPPLTSGALLNAYAVKHDPFAYFASIEEGSTYGSSLKNIHPFEGSEGLFADLATGHLPHFSYIVPNRCDDQHGQNNADAYCQENQGVTVTVAGAAYTGNTFGTQAGLNPGLSLQADTTLQRVVTAIHKSPAWDEGNNAIVVVWDESDYAGVATALPAGSAYPIQLRNRVPLIVELNHHEVGVQSSRFYDSFSLLKTLEGAFGLPCLNHACDSGVEVMSDLFGY